MDRFGESLRELLVTVNDPVSALDVSLAEGTPCGAAHRFKTSPRRRVPLTQPPYEDREGKRRRAPGKAIFTEGLLWPTHFWWPGRPLGCPTRARPPVGTIALRKKLQNLTNGDPPAAIHLLLHGYWVVAAGHVVLVRVNQPE